MRRTDLLGTVGRWWRGIRPERKHLRADVVAGLPGAVASVPDGMASSVLAGVNPVYGLYASIAGPVAGGLTASTRLMVVTTTTAAALAAGSALEDVAAADRDEAMFLLAVLAGVAMIVAGLARLGRYTRFVSHSVMIGFLTGVSVNIVAGQIPDLAGVSSQGSIALAKAADVLANPTNIDGASLLTGLGALALLVVVSRTPLDTVGALVALVVPTAIVLVTGADVAQVSDAGEVPGGLPLPAWPHLGLLSPGLVAGALSVAAIVLVQGAGVSESAPNPDGTRPDTDRDFVAQGVGNLASGFYRGIPVGGSVGQTALNITAGARTRWAGITSGLWMLVILVAFAGVVGEVAMPTLAAVLVYAGIGSLRLAEVTTILRTGPVSQIVVVTTFLATLLLPVAAAVGIGVALSLLLQLNQDAMDLKVVQLVRDDAGDWVEQPAPATLPSHEVTVLDVYGSLLYAGARTLQARLPQVAGARDPVVVLRLRGRTSLGATFLVIVADLAQRLAASGGRLYLSGLDPAMTDRLRRSGRVDVRGPVRLYEATPTVGASTRAAAGAAETWLVTHRPETST